MNRNKQGFSLIELLASISILSILIGYGAPLFQGFVSKSRTIQQSRYLSILIHKARQEAVIRRSSVRFCPLNGQNTCNRNWNAALTMFVDNNNNKRLDQGELIIRQVEKVANTNMTRNYPRTSIYFRYDGLAWGYNGSFSHCYEGDQYHYIRIIISATGRIRSSAMITGDSARVRCGRI